MADLLEVYNDMNKQAEVDELQKERVDTIVKYASAAEEMLEANYGEDYNEEDVAKLAEFLIENDIAAEDDQEKVAEYDQLGRIMARSFLDEVAAAE